MPDPATRKAFLRTRRFAGWLRISLIFSAPLLLGSVHPPVVVAESLLCVVALLLALVPGHRTSGWDRVYVIPWLVVVPAAAAVLALLQLVPVPPVFGATASDGTWRPMSLDPPSTALEAVRLAGLAALALAQVLAARREGVGAIRRVLWAIAAAGAASVVLFLAQWATDAAGILWTYRPRDGVADGSFFRATFVNPGQQAVLMGLAAVACIPLAVDPRRPALRPLAGVLLLASFAGLVLTRSMPAWNAFGAATMLLVAVLAAAKHRAGRRPHALFAALLAVLLIVVIGNIVNRLDLLAPGDAGFETPARPSWSQAELVADAASMVPDHLAAGVGAGSFAAVFPAYNRAAPNLAFHHPECRPLEAVIEFGVPGIALLAALAWAFLRASRRGLSSIVPAGAVAAAGGTAAADLFASGTAANGIAIPAAALIGCVAAEVAEAASGHSGFRELYGPTLTRRALFPVVAAVLVAVAVLGAGPFGPGLRADVDALSARAAAGKLSDDEVEAASRRHPASYRVPMIGAEAAMARGDADATARWLDAAAARAPLDPRVRGARLRAALLAERYDDARALWRELAGPGRHEAARVLRSLWVDPRLRARVALLPPAPDPDHGLTLDVAGFLAAQGRADLVERVMDRATRALPGDPVFVARLGRARLDVGDVDAADRLATAVVVGHRGAPEGYDLMGMVLERRGRFLEAKHAYLEAAALVPRDPEPLFHAADALLAGGDTTGIEAIVGRIDALPADNDTRWLLAVLRSRIAEHDGLMTAAIDRMAEAEYLRPGDPETLTRIADLNEKVGNPQGAALAIRRLLARHPDDARARERLDRIAPRSRPETPAGGARPEGTRADPAGRKKVW
jgi:Flp pilus assembly protein TadD